MLHKASRLDCVFGDVASKADPIFLNGTFILLNLKNLSVLFVCFCFSLRNGRYASDRELLLLAFKIPDTSKPHRLISEGRTYRYGTCCVTNIQ